MITLEDFIAKYSGKLVDANGNVPGQGAYAQCVDLANLYIKEVLGQPTIEHTNAEDFYKNCGSNYDYILNTSTNIPFKGDIVIWSSPDLIGHIAIFVSGTVTGFQSFDQNWPVKSACHIQSHVYQSGGYNVIGWLRYKNLVVTPPMPVSTDESRAIDVLRIFQHANGLGNLEGTANAAIGAYKDNPELKKNIDDLNGKLILEQNLVSDWQTKCDSANQNLLEMTGERDKLQIQLDNVNKDMTWSDILNLIIKKIKS